MYRYYTNFGSQKILSKFVRINAHRLYIKYENRKITSGVIDMSEVGEIRFGVATIGTELGCQLGVDGDFACVF